MNPKYAKPPITEAILDVRVAPRPNVSAVELASIVDLIKADFPKVQEIAASDEMPIPMEVRKAMGLPIGPVLGGFRCESADGQRIVQFRRDAFIFSFAGTSEHRYEGWEVFQSQAKKMWNEYRNKWQPEKIVRLALRYVNQIPMEESRVTSELLAQMNPSRPILLSPPVALSGFAKQVQLSHEDIGADSVVNQALLTEQEMPSYVLDIDIYQSNLSLTPHEDRLWERMEALRERKNQLFRAFITDAMEQDLEPIP